MPKMCEKTKPKLKGTPSQVTFALISSWFSLMLFEAQNRKLELCHYEASKKEGRNVR
jgi:hypothetical protein